MPHDEKLIQFILNAAIRSPSAHNTQPARWYFYDESQVYLLEDNTRQLKVADPTKKDQLIALGCAFEGFILAAQQKGLSFDRLTFDHTSIPITLPDNLKPFCHFTLIKLNDDADKLYHSIHKRATYRGTFIKSTQFNTSGFCEKLSSRYEVRCVTNPDLIHVLAGLHTKSTVYFCQNDAYYHELYSWLRFSKKDLSYHQDGLNNKALDIPDLICPIAKYLLHPTLFKWLRRFKLTKMLVSEEKQINSSEFLLVILSDNSADYFTVGRTFYRIWLELTEAGFSACPLSALVDSESISAQCRNLLEIPADKKIINVFRVGVAPKNNLLSPRLPALYSPST